MENEKEEEDNEKGEIIYSDFWILNLDKMEWKEINFENQINPRFGVNKILKNLFLFLKAYEFYF